MTQNRPSRFGIVNFAETWNGHLAMLGFGIRLAIELLLRECILNRSDF